MPLDDFVHLAGFDLQDRFGLLEFLAKNTPPALDPLDERRATAGPSLESGGIPDLNLLPQKSNCAEFVDTQLISKARDFVYRNKDALGRELLTSIPRNQSEREKKYFNLPVSGFKERLIKHQGGWVFAHVLGIAGGTLIGDARVFAFTSQTGNQLVAQQVAADLKELREVEEMARLGLALYD